LCAQRFLVVKPPAAVQLLRPRPLMSTPSPT